MQRQQRANARLQVAKCVEARTHELPGAPSRGEGSAALEPKGGYIGDYIGLKLPKEGYIGDYIGFRVWGLNSLKVVI